MKTGLFRTACLLVATLAAQPVSAGPCEDALANAYDNGDETFRTKAAAMVQCLNSTKTSFNTIYFTLSNLILTAEQYYSYTHIANNSMASTQTVKCGLQLHDTNVDLLAGLKGLMDKWTAHAGSFLQSGVTDQSTRAMVESLNEAVVPGAFIFHMEIRKLFNKLFDAHTMYIYDCPAGLEVYLDVSGMLEMENGELMLNVMNTDKIPSWRAVSSIMIGGIEHRPLDWLSGLADNMGQYKDRGQRLNNLYQTWSGLGFDRPMSLSTNVFGVDFVSDPVTFKFADDAEPQSVEIEWQANWKANTTTEKLTKMCEVANPMFEAVIKMDMALMDVEKSLREACSQTESCMAVLDSPRRLKTRSARTHSPSGSLHTALKAAQAAFPMLTSEQADEVGRMSLQDMVERSSEKSLDDNHRLSNGVQKLLNAQEDKRAQPRSLLGLESVALDEEGIQSCFQKDPPEGGTAPNVVYSAAFHDGAAGIHVYEMGDAMIYKLSSFGGAPTDMVYGVIGYAIMAQHARKAGIKRVLFDIISNGGGLIDFATSLISLVTHNQDKRTACADYAKRLEEKTLWYLDAYGRDGLELLLKPNPETGYPHDFDSIVNVSPEIAKLFVNSSLSQTHVHLTAASGLGFDVTDEQLAKVKDTQQEIQSATTVANVLDIYYAYLKTKDWLPKELIQMEDPDNEGKMVDIEGWWPYPGNEIIKRETLKPFEDMSHLFDPVKQKWGAGAESMYSKKGLLSCQVVHLEDMIKLFVHDLPATLPDDEHVKKLISVMGETDEDKEQFVTDVFNFLWEDIAVLSDSTSGSAGSLFPTKLFVSGKATLYGYGGIPGELMDTSAFAGGNVLNWDFMWKTALMGNYYAMFIDSDNKWAKWSDAATENGDPSTPTAMPTSAVTTFNFNMMFIPEMSTDTSLPREFYIYPASKRLDKWLPVGTFPCIHTSKYLGMYAEILADNWCAVRSDPPTASLGGWTCASQSICGSCDKVKEVYKANKCCGMPTKKIGSMTCKDMKKDFRRQKCCPR